MKRIIFSMLFLVTLLTVPSVSFAQPMMGRFFGSSNPDSEIAKEEQAGSQIWQKLQSDEASCQNLSDSDYELLGEYFMGAMVGNSHEAINAMLKKRLGNDGEEQMHIAMGKRMSGCDTSAQYPQGFNFMPMMGGWSSPRGFNQNNNNSMMWGYNNPMGWGVGLFGGVFMLLIWILIIAGIVILIKWLANQSRDGREHKGNKALDILKERYAKGEINKEEFEAKKKDLGV